MAKSKSKGSGQIQQRADPAVYEGKERKQLEQDTYKEIVNNLFALVP